MRQLRFLFQEPGFIEAVAIEPNEQPDIDINTLGYRSSWVADLMVDYDPKTRRPYAFMASNFDKTYPLVTWALKIHMHDERFDVPQAGLHAVPLDEAFSWAYAHFILEDHLPALEFNSQSHPTNISAQVLQYAALT